MAKKTAVKSDEPKLEPPKTASATGVCTACGGKGIDIAISDTELCKACSGTGQITTRVS